MTTTSDPTTRHPDDALAPGDARVMLDRQVEVLELIAGAAPLGPVLTRILTSLEGLMPGARCSVLLLDRERATLHHGAAPSLPDAYVAAIDGLAIGDGAGSCGTAAALDVPVVATDVRTDPRWVDFLPAAEAAGLRSCWSTPIEGRDGLPVGTFAVYHDVPHSPDRREQVLVDRFTHLASVAIDHAGLLGDLVESEERFRRSFDDTALGMAILGPDRTVTRGNAALTALAGGDPVGRPLAALLVPTDGVLADLLRPLDPAAGAAPVGFEALLHRDGGLDVEVEVSVSPLHAGVDPAATDEQRGRCVVTVVDLTERRAAERERRARVEAETARRTAERLSHAKSELLAAVGHDARTPIQAIVGFAELLGTMDLDADRRREALGHIGAAATHVMDLLSDVLDLSRLEAGALAVAREPVAVREVVDEVFGLLSSVAATRMVELSHELPDVVVLADRRRLRQVLLNVVGNAVRHGASAGSVEVVLEPSVDPGVVLLAVEDDGPGIAADLLPRLFTPFACAGPAGGEQAPPTRPATAAAEDSVGLGLALSHGLAAAMGGELSVVRTGPTGTCMLLRLPAR